MIIRDGMVVTARGVQHVPIAIKDGRITQVGRHLDEDKDPEELDATGLHIFPGGIDSHVHFNEPGRTEWEDIGHGSTALAAGGYTTFIDMPLNNLPVTTTVDAFDLKLAAMQRSSKLDFGLWAGLVPGNLDQLQGLVERGAMGFKAFMCPSGIDEFPACDKRTLREGMKRIAELGSILLVHAEDPALLTEPNGPTWRDFVESRTWRAENSAVYDAIEWAMAAGCPLHIVHVSWMPSATHIHTVRENGVDVSGETCPHYLLYGEEDLERLGGLGKCAPPFRPTRVLDDMWSIISDGWLQMVVSDHSPSTLDLKQGDDFRKIWGGISGCQSTRQLLLADGRVELRQIAALTSTNIAERFGLENKGDIAEGFDADLWIVDLDHEDVVRREDLLYRNPFSVHEGQKIRGRTVKTLVRGTEPREGRFIRPGARS